MIFKRFPECYKRSSIECARSYIHTILANILSRKNKHSEDDIVITGNIRDIFYFDIVAMKNISNIFIHNACSEHIDDRSWGSISK